MRTIRIGLEAVLEVTEPLQWEPTTYPKDEWLEPSWPRVMDAQRAPMRRLAGRLPAHWTAWILQLLRGVHPHHRFDVQSARQVAEGTADIAVAAEDRIAQLSARLACLAAGSQRVDATRIPASLITWSTRRREVVRVYLPPDANCLLSVMDHCLRSRHYVNVVVAGKQPAPQWLTMDPPSSTALRGLASGSGPPMTKGCEPDVVMACCGDVPTLETLAAVRLFASICLS